MGLCANGQYVMEILNIGVAQVYNASNLQPASGVVSLDSLMGLTGLNWGSGGDVSCLYDYNNGGHWFIIEFVSTTPEPTSPFTGCFAAVVNTCREGIAASMTNNPMGGYRVYFLNPNNVNADPGVGYLLNDFAKIGTTQDAFMLSYDEFNLNPATYPSGPCPGTFGCFGFNGAQQFAFSKNALETGQPASSVNVAYENMGTASNLYPIPANGAFQPESASCSSGKFAGFVCWYQVIPAQTPDPSQFDNSNGGTGFTLAGGDFFGNGDNRIAAFDWTGLSALSSSGCNSCGNINFGGQIFTIPSQSYIDEGLACPAPAGGGCSLAAQKAGLIPLGNTCGANGLSSSTSCPESGIATNFDGITQVSYADGLLWAADSTLVTQTFGKSSAIDVGAGYWEIGTSSFDSSESFSVINAGYVAAIHEDIEFPAIAGTDSGGAVMSFTLSGNSGRTGGYYPSSAYIVLARSNGISPVGKVIHITALGQSPQDGFTEYLGYPHATSQRWGDYGQAIFVPFGGANPHSQGTVYFSSEYIQYPNCNSLAVNGVSCGGTRTTFANWGTSINSIQTG